MSRNQCDRNSAYNFRSRGWYTSLHTISFILEKESHRGNPIIHKRNCECGEKEGTEEKIKIKRGKVLREKVLSRTTQQSGKFYWSVGLMCVISTKKTWGSLSGRHERIEWDSRVDYTETRLGQSAIPQTRHLTRRKINKTCWWHFDTNSSARTDRKRHSLSLSFSTTWEWGSGALYSIWPSISKVEDLSLK